RRTRPSSSNQSSRWPRPKSRSARPTAVIAASASQPRRRSVFMARQGYSADAPRGWTNRRGALHAACTMSTSRLERVDGRDAVLDAALREFGRYGYADASLESILREGHMSEQLFRVHFEDKAGLAVAVIERERERHLGWVGHLRAATTKDQFWAAVRAKTVTELRPGETSSLDLARLSISAHRHHEVAVRLA